MPCSAKECERFELLCSCHVSPAEGCARLCIAKGSERFECFVHVTWLTSITGSPSLPYRQQHSSSNIIRMALYVGLLFFPLLSLFFVVVVSPSSLSASQSSLGTPLSVSFFLSLFLYVSLGCLFSLCILSSLLHLSISFLLFLSIPTVTRSSVSACTTKHIGVPLFLIYIRVTPNKAALFLCIHHHDHPVVMTLFPPLLHDTFSSPSSYRVSLCLALSVSSL